MCIYTEMSNVSTTLERKSLRARAYISIYLPTYRLWLPRVGCDSSPLGFKTWEVVRASVVEHGLSLVFSLTPRVAVGRVGCVK